MVYQLVKVGWLGEALLLGLAIWDWTEQWVDDASDFLEICVESAQLVCAISFGMFVLAIAGWILCLLLW